MDTRFRANIRAMILKHHMRSPLGISQWLNFEITMSVYVRVEQIFDHASRKRYSVISVANVSTGVQRQGTFTRMIRELSTYGLPIVLENVLIPEFQQALTERHGWEILERGVLAGAPQSLILRNPAEGEYGKAS